MRYEQQLQQPSVRFEQQQQQQHQQPVPVPQWMQQQQQQQRVPVPQWVQQQQQQHRVMPQTAHHHHHQQPGAMPHWQHTDEAQGDCYTADYTGAAAFFGQHVMQQQQQLPLHGIGSISGSVAGQSGRPHCMGTQWRRSCSCGLNTSLQQALCLGWA
jgi:hypothetical protein